MIGPRSRAAFHPGKELATCIRVRLRPGAAARSVSGVPAGELRDGAVALTEVWGGRATRLENRLDE
ncbi:hypothetical protein [Streptomyces noursei]|uniref:hypothetical protein n=1 Tax=Streptomyces noursei TaxID=1971 RepID=UPI0035E02BBC